MMPSRTQRTRHGIHGPGGTRTVSKDSVDSVARAVPPTARQTEGA